MGRIGEQLRLLTEFIRSEFATARTCYELPELLKWYQAPWYRRRSTDGLCRAMGMTAYGLFGSPSPHRALRTTFGIQQQFAAALVQAESGPRTRSEFLANMSHEFRPPHQGRARHGVAYASHAARRRGGRRRPRTGDPEPAGGPEATVRNRRRLLPPRHALRRRPRARGPRAPVPLRPARPLRRRPDLAPARRQGPLQAPQGRGQRARGAAPRPARSPASSRSAVARQLRRACLPGGVPEPPRKRRS